MACLPGVVTALLPAITRTQTLTLLAAPAALSLSLDHSASILVDDLVLCSGCRSRREICIRIISRLRFRDASRVGDNTGDYRSFSLAASFCLISFPLVLLQNGRRAIEEPHAEAAVRRHMLLLLLPPLKPPQLHAQRLLHLEPKL